MFNRDASPDPFARRLMLGGCGLMLLPPLAALVFILYFGWPTMMGLLPRGTQPVAPAGPFERLVLVTTLDGPTTDNPTQALDAAIVDAQQSIYLGGVRIARLRETPQSAGDVDALIEEYNADVVLWGAWSEGGTTVTYTLAEPPLLALPETITVSLDDPPTDQDNEHIGSFTIALLALMQNDPFQADNMLSRLPSNVESFGLPPDIVVIVEAWTQQQLSRATFAIPTIENGLADDPDNPHLNTMLSLLLRDVGRLSEALDAINIALEANPGSAPLLLERAEIYRLGADFEAAEDDLETVLQEDPDNRTALERLASLYRQTGDLTEATAVMDRLIALQPDSWAHHISRAQLYAQLGQTQNAEADFDRALELAQEDTSGLGPVHNARGQFFRQQELYTQALAEYDALINWEGTTTTTTLNRGIIYWEMGEIERARQVWEADLYQFGSGQAMQYNNLAWELAISEYYEAGLYYSDLSLSLNPTDPNSLHTHGYINLNLGEYAGAIGDFGDALNNGLNYDPVYRDLGDAFYGLEQWDDAVFYYERYLDVFPNAVDRAEVQQNLDEARAALEES